MKPLLVREEIEFIFDLYKPCKKTDAETVKSKNTPYPIKKNVVFKAVISHP